MSLFTEFPVSTEEDWKKQIEKDLKGISFENLSSYTFGTIKRNPFYTKNIGTSPLFFHSDWDILELSNIENTKSNQLLLQALNSGASGYVINLNTEVSIPSKLNGIESNYINSNFRLLSAHQNILEQLSNYFESFQNVHQWNASVSFDFVAHLLETGNYFNSNKEDTVQFLSIQKEFSTKSGIRSVVVEGSIYQNSGANPQTEIGMLLAHAHHYLVLLLETGFPKDRIASLFQFNVSIGSDFFLEISKLRALHKTWSFILSKYEITPEVYLSAFTSLVDKTSSDPYTNLLRSSLQGMAAVIGGAKSLCIFPFDYSYKEPDEFSLRMARNQQLILKEEAYLDKVSDAAGGSYYVESLTQELELLSYSIFQEVEKKGGIIAAAEQGFIQEKIKRQGEELISMLNEGKLSVIGLNCYHSKKNQGSEVQNKKEIVSRRIYKPQADVFPSLRYIHFESMYTSVATDNF